MRLLVIAILSLTPSLSAFAQPHVGVSRSGVQTANGIETGNLVLDFHNGDQHVIPYVAEETSYLTARIQSPGSHWLPIIDMSIGFSGPGVGGGGGGGGGGGPPTVIQGIGAHRPLLSDPTITVAPALAWAARACLAGIAASLGIAEFTCRNSGGVSSFEYSLCSFGSASINCNEPPPPPAPNGSGGGGGGSSGGGGGGGGGGGVIGSAGMGASYSIQTVTGEIIVSPLQDE